MLASLSIAGLPPLLGFLAKEQLSSQLPGAAGWLVTALGAGTVAVYARIWGPPLPSGGAAAAETPAVAAPGASPGAIVLTSALVLLSASPWTLPLWAALHRQALAAAMLKSATVFAAGLMLHRLLVAHAPAPAAPGPAPVWRPRLEGLDDLLGAIVLLAALLLGLLGWRP
jgi:hypothetical protein